jgi:hypothetical protein
MNTSQSGHTCGGVFLSFISLLLKRKFVIAGSTVVLSQTLAVSHGDDNIIGHRAKVIVQM